MVGLLNRFQLNKYSTNNQYFRAVFRITLIFNSLKLNSIKSVKEFWPYRKI